MIFNPFRADEVRLAYTVRCTHGYSHSVPSEHKIKQKKQTYWHANSQPPIAKN